MKQNTSAGCLQMFSNEQACVMLFNFPCAECSILDVWLFYEPGKDIKDGKNLYL